MTDRQSVIDALTKPFPREAIKQNQKRDYVPGTTVIYRLNEATNYDWEFEITGHELVGGADSQGNKPAQVVYGRMRIPIVSSGWRADMGTQALENMADDHEAYKGAATDCLKRCARQFGVGLHLWGPDIEAGEIGNRGRVDQPRQPVRPEMVSVPDAGGGFRRVPADSPAAAHAAIQDAEQLARQQAPERMAEEAIGQPIQNVADATMQHMTERQRSFIWAMTRERGMTEEMVKAQVREFYGKEFSEMLRRDASAYIERLKSVDVVPGTPPASEPHPAVQTAMANNTANWIAAMEGAGNMVELSRLANEATAAKAMNDYVRAAFNKQRDRLQEKALA